MSAKTKRNLDGMYFSVERDGEWDSVCFSDMTKEERDELADLKAGQMPSAYLASWWRSMAEIMADRLYDIGEQFGIVAR